MQCFRVGYRGICHESLVFSVYTRAFLSRVCLRRKYKWQVACFTVSHEKALHNYFIPCLSLRKTYGNFGKSSEISANFRKLGNASNLFLRSLNDLWKFWKTSETLSSKVFSRCFYGIFLKNFRKIFGSVRKSSDIFGKLQKRFKSNFEIFLWFFKIFGKSSENLRKCSQVFENDFRMCSEMFVIVRRSWKAEKSSNGTQ